MYLAIKDITTEIIDKRGVTVKKLGGEFLESGHRVISAKLIKNSKIDINAGNERFVNKDIYKKWMPSKLIQGDVILTSEAPLGEVAFIEEDLEWCLGQRLFCLRPDPKIIDGKYFFYAMQTKKVQADLESRGTGTTVVGIRQSELLNVQIPIKDLATQKKISDFLGSLDKKIELNLKMNETLEEIAKTLFKSWFIDFDPVKAKAEGRPTGLSKEISDLFPESFEDSELGEIPEGWNIKKISDIFEAKKGSTPATKNTEFWEPKEHIWVSPRDLSQNPYIYLFHSGRGISEIGLQKTRSGLLPENTVMMSSRAPIGLLGISGANVALATGIFAIPPKKIMSSGLTYFFVDDQIRKLKQLSIGTTFEEVSLKIFNNLMIVFPNDEILVGTKDIFDNLFKKIKNNTLEIKSLINIRDALLPKLISGELKITNAENLIEEANV